MMNKDFFDFNECDSNVTNADVKAKINKFINREIKQFKKDNKMNFNNIIEYLDNCNQGFANMFTFVAPKRINADNCPDNMTMKQFKIVKNEYEQKNKIFNRFQSVNANDMVASKLTHELIIDEFSNKNKAEITKFANAIFDDVYADVHDEGMIEVVSSVEERVDMFKFFDKISHK